MRWREDWLVTAQKQTYDESDEDCGRNIDEEEVYYHGLGLISMGFVSSELGEVDDEVFEDKLDDDYSNSDADCDACFEK